MLHDPSKTLREQLVELKKYAPGEPTSTLDGDYVHVWRHTNGAFMLTRFIMGHEQTGSYRLDTLEEAIDTALMLARLTDTKIDLEHGIDPKGTMFSKTIAKQIAAFIASDIYADLPSDFETKWKAVDAALEMIRSGEEKVILAEQVSRGSDGEHRTTYVYAHDCALFGHQGEQPAPRTAGDWQGARTYRQNIAEAISQVTHDAIGGSPWADDVEAGLRHLFDAIDQAVDATPALRDIFDKPIAKPVGDPDDLPF